MTIKITQTHLSFPILNLIQLIRQPKKIKKTSVRLKLTTYWFQGVCSFCWNCTERQILWSLCSVDFHALTLQLPIQTPHSVAPELQVFVSSLKFSVRTINHYTTEPNVSGRYRKASSNLQSCLTDSSWIQLILLIKRIQDKILKPIGGLMDITWYIIVTSDGLLFKAILTYDAQILVTDDLPWCAEK